MIRSLLFCLVFLSTGLVSAQVLSFQHLTRFSVQQVDSIRNSLGVPAFLVNPEYEVDYYSVTYLTPYGHPDSLVQASMGLAIPYSPGCDFPVFGWGHGTNARADRAASLMNGGQWDLGVLFASLGYITALPDYLGLGDYDPKVTVHPYIHAYSQAHTMINSVRAGRVVADTTGGWANQYVYLAGYSQGGFTTVATLKEMQLNYPQEFTIAATAPMSGPYDLIEAQVDLIASDSVYPTPGYLPFILMSYQSMYGNLYDSIEQVLKSPWDTLIPPLFYNKQTSIGAINNLCTPVPKHMIQDSVVNAFLADSLHPLRLDLKDNHLIDGWFPTSPMRLFYCDGDDQVTYLNSTRAYDAWTLAGAPDLTAQNMGTLDHGDCAPDAIMAGKLYFDGYRQICINAGVPKGWQTGIRLFPNPSTDRFTLSFLTPPLDETTIRVLDLTGREVASSNAQGMQQVIVKTDHLPAGVYVVEVVSQKGVWTERWVRQ